MIKDGKWGIKFLTLEFDELRINQVEACNNWNVSLRLSLVIS